MLLPLDKYRLDVELAANDGLKTDVCRFTDPVKQLIIIRRDLKMRRGKEIAQGAHASMKFLSDMVMQRDNACDLTDEIVEWLSGSFTKIVLQVPDEIALLQCYQTGIRYNLVTSLITDNGTTEFGGVPTYTAVAIGPARSSKLNSLFEMLKLY